MEVYVLMNPIRTADRVMMVAPGGIAIPGRLVSDSRQRPRSLFPNSNLINRNY